MDPEILWPCYGKLMQHKPLSGGHRDLPAALNREKTWCINPRREVGNRTEISLQTLYNSQVGSLCKCCAYQCEILFLFHRLFWERIFVCERNNSKVFERAEGEQKDLKHLGRGMAEGISWGRFIRTMNPLHSKPHIKTFTWPRRLKQITLSWDS